MWIGSKLIPLDKSASLDDYRFVHDQIFKHKLSDRGLHPRHYIESWLADLCFA